MRPPVPAVFVAATGQHVGKTTVCLALVDVIKRMGVEVGYVKPVGQQHVVVPATGTDSHGASLSVDKDAFLFKSHFGLKQSWQSISPVLMPSVRARRRRRSRRAVARFTRSRIVTAVC
jgi:dethiobiotin synthetase